VRERQKGQIAVLKNCQSGWCGRSVRVVLFLTGTPEDIMPLILGNQTNSKRSLTLADIAEENTGAKQKENNVAG